MLITCSYDVLLSREDLCHAFVPFGRSRGDCSGATRGGAGLDKRLGKTTAVAWRLIAGTLGVRAPKRKDEEKGYDSVTVSGGRGGLHCLSRDESRRAYKRLMRFAIDILTIPASSCECERLFSELGDLLEPRRRKIGSQFLAAIQCVRSWRDAGFKPPSDRNQSEVTDEEIAWAYDICSWDTDAR
jgi:hypothetical protein